LSRMTGLWGEKGEIVITHNDLPTGKSLRPTKEGIGLLWAKARLYTGYEERFKKNVKEIFSRSPPRGGGSVGVNEQTKKTRSRGRKTKQRKTTPTKGHAQGNGGGGDHRALLKIRAGCARGGEKLAALSNNKSRR